MGVWNLDLSFTREFRTLRDSLADLLRVILKSTLKSAQKNTQVSVCSGVLSFLLPLTVVFSCCSHVLVALDSIKCVCAPDTRTVQLAGN